MGRHDIITEHAEQANNFPEKSGEIATLLVDADHSNITVTPELNRQCLRRIDLMLMPIMFISFGFQYMDKSCLTGAALFGIIEDLNLYEVVEFDGQSALDLSRYSYASLIFYWGFLLGLIPGVYLSQRFPLGKYTGVIIMLWGSVTICTVAVKSYEGLLVQRFFLGVAEAGIAPAFSLITSMWYKRDEQPLRLAIWYSSTGIGTLIGTLCLYAIGHIHGSLAVWKYQFMIIGAVSSVWGCVVFAFLPDNPVSAKFLSHDLRIIAIERMRDELIGIENKTVKLYQIKETLTDPKTWFLVVTILALTLTNGALGAFGTVITTSFGYSTFESILLLGVVGVVIFISVLISGMIAVFTPNSRIYCALFCCLPPIAGSVMIWKSNWTNKAVPLWGLFLMGFFPAVYVMLLSLMTANTAGHTKKAMTAGLIWAASCASNGVAPLTVLTEEKAAHYPTCFRIILSTLSLTFVLLLSFRFYLVWLNKKRDARGLPDETHAAATAFYDLTDGENHIFRYRL